MVRSRGLWCLSSRSSVRSRLFSSRDFFLIPSLISPCPQSQYSRFSWLDISVCGKGIRRQIRVTGFSQHGSFQTSGSLSLPPLAPRAHHPSRCLNIFRASVWVAGSIAIWSIASSLVLHLAATGRSVDKMALFVNVAGIATPLVVVCVAVPLGVIGGRFYSRTLGDYLRIQENLAVQARRWTPGTEFDVSTLVPEIPLFESLLSNIDGLGKFARSTYIFFSVASLSLLCVITSVGGYFLITLRRVLSRSNAMFTTGAKDEGHKRVKRSLNVSSEFYTRLRLPSRRRNITKLVFHLIIVP